MMRRGMNFYWISAEGTLISSLHQLINLFHRFVYGKQTGVKTAVEVTDLLKIASILDKPEKLAHWEVQSHNTKR